MLTENVVLNENKTVCACFRSIIRIIMKVVIMANDLCINRKTVCACFCSIIRIIINVIIMVVALVRPKYLWSMPCLGGAQDLHRDGAGS